MVCDGENQVKSLRGRQLSDKVHSDDLEWLGLWRGVYGLQRCFGWLIVDLMSLTIPTPTHIVHDIPLQVGPPVASFHEVGGPTDARVTVHWRVVEHCNDLSLSFDSCGDDDAISLPPPSSNFL
jgi:hypothetical protein